MFPARTKESAVRFSTCVLLFRLLPILLAVLVLISCPGECYFDREMGEKRTASSPYSVVTYNNASIQAVKTARFKNVADRLSTSLSIQGHFHPNFKMHTVEPLFNKVPRDWGNVFVISRVHFRYNKFLEKQSKCLLYRGIVNDCF